MICILPTYLQTYLPGPDRRIFYFNWRKGMIQLDSQLSNGHTSIFLFPQSILLSAACRYQARRSSRSGQPSFRRMCMRVLPRLSWPPPPQENTYCATNPERRSGSWFVVYRQPPICLSCLPILPVALIPVTYASCSRLCIYCTYYWSHTAQFWFLLPISFNLVITIGSLF